MVLGAFILKGDGDDARVDLGRRIESAFGRRDRDLRWGVGQRRGAGNENRERANDEREDNR